MSSASDFGKDHGLVHEAVVTGRKVGWGSDEWAKLAHDEDFMRKVRMVMLGEASITVLALLVPVGGPIMISCPAHDPRDGFWQTGPDLWVDPDLAKYILPAAQALPAREVRIERFDLKRNANDSRIREDGAGLPKRHVFTASEFLSAASAMILRQPKGCAGDLLNTGWANIFYVEGVVGEVFAVRVGWVSGFGQWDVDVWRLDDSTWDAGYRVVSPATAAVPL